MSSVQTLTASPAKAKETALPRAGAFLIPTPVIPLEPDRRTLGSEAGPRFSSVLTSVSHKSAASTPAVDKRTDVAKDRKRRVERERNDDSAAVTRKDREASSTERTEDRKPVDEPRPSDNEQGASAESPRDDAVAAVDPSDDAGSLEAQDASESQEPTAVATADVEAGEPEATAQAAADPAASDGASEAAPAEQTATAATLLKQLAAQSEFVPNAQVQAAAVQPAAGPADGAASSMQQQAGAQATAQAAAARVPQVDADAASRGGSESDDLRAGKDSAETPRKLFDRLLSSLRGVKTAARSAAQEVVDVASTPTPARELARLLAMASGLADASAGRADTVTARDLQTSEAAPGERAAATQPIVSSTQAPSRQVDGAAGRAQASRPVAAPQQAAAGEAARNFEKVVEIVRSSAGAKNSSMTIRLEPPELGEMKLDARMRNDVLTLKIEAATDAAKLALESRVQDLRQALERHGIVMDRVSIDVRPPSQGSQAGAQDHRASQDSSPQQQSDGGVPEQWQHQGTQGEAGRRGEGEFAERLSVPDAAEASSGSQADLSQEANQATESLVNMLA